MNIYDHLKKHPFYHEYLDRHPDNHEIEFHDLKKGKEIVRVWKVEETLTEIEVRFAAINEDDFQDIVYVIYDKGKWSYEFFQGELKSPFMKELIEYVKEYYDKRDRLRRLFI